MKYLAFILECFIVIGIVLLAFKNFNSEFFLQASLVNILTLSIAFFITYYMKGAKERNKQLDDNVERIISEIEQLIRTEDMFSDNNAIALTSMTACANRIDYLKKYESCIDIQGFKGNIQLLDNWFTEIRDLYSPDKKTREKKYPRMQKLRELMIARCIEIRLAIYVNFA